MPLVTFLLLLTGLYLVVIAPCPGVYRPAAAVLRRRAPKPLTQSQILIHRLAQLLLPYMDMEPIQRTRLQETLASLGRTESPESFRANNLAKALVFSAALAWTPLINPVLGVGLMGVCCAALFRQEEKKLYDQVAQRRQEIERELPQLASTIRQSLNTTHDVVSILQTYQKVCGSALSRDIHRTLNDMITGNPERALKSLESRVASPHLGQLVRGLVSVLRGDDQRLYFDMLSAEFRKAQNESVAQELLKRPEKLYLNMGLLFVCMVLMICASLGTYLAQQMGTFF